METIDEIYLRPTEILDSRHPEIVAYAEKVVGHVEKGPVEKAVMLYYAVRDGIWYDPYYPFYLPEHYRASNVLKSGRGYCVCKASLLCALGRTCGIPSRLGFANVKNHLATKQLIEHLGSDLFVYHGFVEFYLEGKWVISTPAFNRELCERHSVLPLEFNGREDSLFQPYNAEKKQFMEYVEYLGSYGDVPLDQILEAWKRVYGHARVKKWVDLFEKSGGMPLGRFDKEDILQD